MLINTVPICKSRHPGRSCCRSTLPVAWFFNRGAEGLLQEHSGADGEHHFISEGAESTHAFTLSKADLRHWILLHLGLSKGLSPPIRPWDMSIYQSMTASQGRTGPHLCLSPWDVLRLLNESFPLSSPRISQEGLLSLCPPTGLWHWSRDLSEVSCTSLKGKQK